MAPSDIEIGPIPAGTPVGLLANLALISEASIAAERASAIRAS